MLAQSNAITVRASAIAGTQPDSLLLMCDSSACTPRTAAICPAALVLGLQINSSTEWFPASRLTLCSPQVTPLC